MSVFGLIIKSLVDPSSVKGEIGEQIVKDLLTNQKNFHSFHDITVSGQQIDHVLICTKGVFTIETKNYQGTIYGSHVKRDWSQVFECMGRYSTYYKKFTLYNPVMQAENHSKALYYYLKKAQGVTQYVKSIVVFTGTATLKVFSPKVPVIYHHKLIDRITSLPDVMSLQECNAIASMLQNVVHDSVNQDKTTFHQPVAVINS